MSARITDKAMQATPAPTDTWLIESFGRGHGALVGRITPAGSRSFYYRYTAPEAREQVRLTVGSFAPKGDGIKSFTVAQARTKAMEWAAMRRDGIKDLRGHLAQQVAIEQQQHAEELRRLEEAREAAERATRQRVSMRALFDRWCETELAYRSRPDGSHSGRKDSGTLAREQFERHVFPLLGELTAKDVTKADVMRVIDAQMNAGKQRTATMLFSDMRQMFAFALDRELIERDPMATLKKARIVGAPIERDRILSADEVRTLALAIPRAGLNPRSECAIWLMLATGCRIGELVGAVWEDKAAALDGSALEQQAEADGVKLGFVSLSRKVWHLPDTKNGRDHTIHLSDFALRQFERLRELIEATPWVFPNTAGSGPVCVKSLGKQLADRQRQPEDRLSGRSKNTQALALPGGKWTAHDLRRTAASLMAELGISGDVIDECLNHMIESRVRRTYIRNRRQAEQACAFEALGRRLEGLISGEEVTAPSNVIPLRAA